MSTMAEAREREGILDDLASSDEELRRLAVERLVELPEDEALPRLLEALGDQSWRVRKSAVDRLVSCSAREELGAALIGALADGENSGRRNSAFEVLVGIGRPMTARLVETLASEDVDVRKLAVDALAGIADPEAAEPVCRCLQDPDANVRGAAADALGLIGGETSTRALRQVAVTEHEDQLVRLSALRALDDVGHPLGVDELAGVLEVSVLRPAAYALLGRRADEAAVACLLKGIDVAARTSREAAMEALVRVLSKRDGVEHDALVERIREATLASEHVIESSLSRLASADLATRMMLIQFLGLSGDSRIVVPILECGRDEAIAEVASSTLESLGATTVRALRDAWEELPLEARIDACSLLGRLDGECDPTALLLGALDDVHGELRAAAARALGERRCVDALPGLVRRLESAAMDAEPESEEEVAALIDGLVMLAERDDSNARSIAEDVIARLADRLEGAEDEVRLAIAGVLGRIGRHEDDELVARLLRDPNARVRRAAVEALSRLEPGAASEPLRLALADEAPLVRVAAAVALGQSTNPAVIDDLQRLIHDDDSRVSAAAVRSIGKHCREDKVPVERAVALIEHALDCDGMVVLAAVDALSMIGGDTAARAALPVLGRTEPEPAQAAVACIGEHGDPETVASLISLIGHESWSVRAEAIQTLADRNIERAVPAILRRLETEQDSFVRDSILRALKRLED